GCTPHTNELAEQIDAMDIGFTMRVTILGHIQRGGKPSAFDRLLATRFGYHAVQFLLNGQTNVMVGLDGRDMVPVPLQTVVSKRKTLSRDYLQMAKTLAQ
ncbi:ATP-dependent 6-phosphofructokinase, partial [bacterium]